MTLRPPCLAFLCAILAVTPLEAASTHPKMALTLGTLYGSPLKPGSVAGQITDGFGFLGLAEWQPSKVFGLGAGLESVYFYKPGGPSVRASSFNFTARLRKPGSAFGSTPYFLAGVGFNTLGAGGNHWEGKNHFQTVIGSRLGLVPSYSVDLGIGYHWLGPSPNRFEYMDVRAAFVMEFGKSPKQDEKKETPSPSPSPTAGPVTLAGSMVTMTPTGTPTPGKTPTPSKTVSAAAATPSPTAWLTPTPIPSPEAYMKDMYDQGIRAYKAKKYKSAVMHLKQCLILKDPRIKDYYYAEANAMLGVIYQHHGTGPNRLKSAEKYYRAALAIDPQTETARRGLASLKGNKPKAKPVSKPKPKATPTPASAGSVEIGP